MSRITNLEEAALAFPPMWTIYDHPRDFPGHFVIRVWYGAFVTPEIWLRPTLEAAREVVWANGGGFCFLRDPNDEPQIVESWI